MKELKKNKKNITKNKNIASDYELLIYIFDKKTER